MKKQLLLLLFVLIKICLNAQITLEQTYAGYIFAANTHLQTVYYSIYPVNSNQFNFYNEDYSFYKTVTVTPPTGYICSQISNVSDNLFNNDDLIEFTCTFFDNSSSTGYLLKLYNETGNELFNFGNSFSGWYYKTFNDEVRFNVLRYINYPNAEYETDIYSLPGSMVSAKSLISEINEISPYPNPANNFINLTYNIDQSEIVDLQIFSLNGHLIETKKIGGAFDRIRLDVSNYSSGIYFYQYKSETEKFIVE